MDRHSQFQGQIAAEAADWFARLQEPGQPTALREEFSQWLLRSPAHVEEFLAISRAWGDLDLAPADEYSTESLVAAAKAEPENANVVSLTDASLDEPSPGFDGTSSSSAASIPSAPPAKRRSAQRVAAAAAVLAVGALTYFSVQHWGRSPHLRTAVGEQRTLALSDGSIVHLNTDSDLTITLAPHERRIHLLKGEARFEVAKDKSRPFFVDTQQATVRAVGTVFNVRAVGVDTAVTVVEGRVELTGHVVNGPQGSASVSTQPAGGPAIAHAASAPILKTQLGVGERAAVTMSGEILLNTGPAVDRVLAWSDQRLVFRDEALIDVVSEFNRYQTRPIRIADPALAGMIVSGTFATNDADSLLQYLQRYHHVLAEENADGSRVLKLEHASGGSAP
ncbi:MAG: FecR domain-containing protein [Gammaproteobacteria bacterium]